MTGSTQWIKRIKQLAALTASVAMMFAVAPASAIGAEGLPAALKRTVKVFGAGGLRGLESYSTGFLVSPEGHIVTIWNHVLDVEPITVVLDDGRKYEADIVGTEPKLDLAVIKLRADSERFDHFDLENVPSAGVGDRIFALSNMYKVAVGDEPVSVMSGVVSAVTSLEGRRGGFEIPFEGDVFLFDAITNNPGAGGGIVITRSGKPLGMIGREIRNADSNTWVNYAIPLRDLKTPIEQILSGTYERIETRPDDVAGDQLEPADFGLVMLPDVVYRTPAYVGSVIPDSLVATAGIERGDLVVFIGDELVQSIRDLKSALAAVEESDDVRLIVRRGDELITVEVTAPEKSE
ncbi:S1C family serine protease [Stratiformator vulcanicus]|uniref:Serine protease HtrA n=1 Tax=Stratiformator vulcanicus TaxID=2527980 RepID=A0A517R2R1_9PLAN|nr:S1C family serine protease [Stratiformator vulcanicus]QDT38133.1 Putative serine protease HtrA [Stratiformator vulcanicus]